MYLGNLHISGSVLNISEYTEYTEYSARKAVPLIVKGVNQGGANMILLVLKLRAVLIPWLEFATSN